MRLIKYLFFISLFSILFLIFYFLGPTSFSDEKIHFIVPLDAKREDILARLKEKSLVRNPSVFSLILAWKNFPGDIEPGSYLLSHRQTALSIADTLLFHPYQKWAVIVPGLRVEQVAEKLGKKFNWDSSKTKEFLDNAQEGYMFPDTYLLNVDYTGKQFAERLINNFNEHFDAKLQKDLLALNEKWTTAIKVASLIERESGSDEDKALISGIIWNRLNQDMPLQIDATIQYAIGNSTNWWPPLTGQDLRTDSLYNTYLHKGLPPSSIASPSLASIKAAVYPQDTDCLFYLHDKNKQIHCSKTYEEHKENIQKYLE